MSADFDFSISQLIDSSIDPEVRDAEWRRMFSHFDPRLREFFQHRVKSELELDELLSEVWRRVLIGIHNLSSHRATWSWMTTIGVNVLKSKGRSESRSRRREEEFEREVSADPTVVFVSRIDEDSRDETRLAAALARISALPAEDQELVRLVANEVPHAEIAKLLNLPSAAACRQRLRRIRVAVQAELGGVTESAS